MRQPPPNQSLNNDDSGDETEEEEENPPIICNILGFNQVALEAAYNPFDHERRILHSQQSLTRPATNQITSPQKLKFFCAFSRIIATSAK
jgi:hypothetical protein